MNRTSAASLLALAVAALAGLAGETLRLRASLIAEDGGDEVHGVAEGTGPELGAHLAADLLVRASPAIRRLFQP